MMELAQYAGHKVKLYFRIRICFGKFRLLAKETEYDLIRIGNFVCTVYSMCFYKGGGTPCYYTFLAIYFLVSVNAFSPSGLLKPNR
jgi:hypothetical protein